MRSEPEPEHESVSLNVVLVSLMAAIGGILYGYGISSPSGAIGPKNQDTLVSPQIRQVYECSDFQVAAFLTSNLGGAFLGSLLVYQVGDRLGRKGVLQISGLFHLIGSLVIVFAPLPSNSGLFSKDALIFMFCIGQVVYGMGIGFAMHSSPLYIAEVAPTYCRGRMVSLKELGTVFGILLGYMTGYAFSRFDYGWKYIYGYSAILSAIFMIAFRIAPESPRVLALREGQKTLESECVAVLQILRKGIDQESIQAEADEIFQSVETEQYTQVSVYHLFQGTSKKAMIIVLGLVFFQQVTGQPSVLSYVPLIFEQAGFQSRAQLSSIFVALAKVLATIVAVIKVDQFGRRNLLLTGIAGMLASLLFLVIGFSVSFDTIDVYTFTPTWGLVILIALIIYVSFYQIGFGPITWLIQAEIFPLQTRGKAQSLAVLFNFALNLLVGFFFLPFNRIISTIASFSIYAMFAICSLMFVYYRVPETKNRSLEEIEAMLSLKSFRGSKREVEKFSHKFKSKA